MKVRLISALVVSSFVTACSTPSAGLKIEPPKGSSKDDLILLGTLELPNSGLGEWAGILAVSDGEVTCSGKDESSKVDMGWAVGRLQHNIKLECDDGRTGSVNVNLSGTTRENMSGVGVGKLNDGSKLRLVVGDAVGTLSW